MGSTAPIAVNRKARHEYHILERYEAGIVLSGAEVKSARNGKITLAGGYARIQGDTVMLHGVTIQPYECAPTSDYIPSRPRRLLLHKREIARLSAMSNRKRYTLVPLSAYLTRGMVKLELALCAGKTREDRREDLKRKAAQRETERAFKRRR